MPEKRILTKQELGERLYAYYAEHYGERDTDEWYDPPAVNVCVFRREGQYISLKAHILTGAVEVFVEEAKK